MKVLTIHQPWAWLIVHGHKPIENRTWATSHRGPLLIQASSRKHSDFEEAVQFAARLGVRVPDKLEFGAIIGAVNVTGCVERSKSPWFTGPVGWLLADPVALPPTAISGRLGIYDLPAELSDVFEPLLNRSLSGAQLRLLP